MRNPKFNDLIAEMSALHERKNGDYASDGNPYSNFEEAAAVAAGFSGVDAVFAALIGVKLARLRELTSSGKTPNNESINDTRTDLAMYATLWASYHRKPVHAMPLVHDIVNTRTYDDIRNDAAKCEFCDRPAVTNPKACAGGCLFARWPSR